MPFEVDVWQIWIIAGIVLFIAEIFLPAFLMGSLGIAAWAAAIAAGLDLSLSAQVLVFSITLLVVFFLARPFFNRTLARFDQPLRTGVQALIGREALVVEAIDNTTNRGRVKIGGETWKAQTASGTPMAEGARATVERIEGVTVFVNPKE